MSDELVKALREGVEPYTGIPAAEAVMHKAADEIERLRKPWRAVDQQDWDYIISALGDGGRGRFWKAVLREARAALERK